MAVSTSWVVITGASFTLFTVISKSEKSDPPMLSVTDRFTQYVPISACVGVPPSRPEFASIESHVALVDRSHVRTSPSSSNAS